MTPPRTSNSDPQERAYFAHDDTEAYICWDCATPEEREDPVPDGDAHEEQCARCGVWWEAFV